MSLDLFRVISGIDIQQDDLLDNSNILIGDGAPGTRQQENDAPVGSIYMRTNSNVTSGEEKLQLYWKHTAGSGADKWALATSKEYVDAAVQGLSWREPAIVQDSTSTALPTGTPGSPILVDGVSITDGERVLFTALTSGSPPDLNVYVYDQASGTFVTDPANTATDGDAVFVQEGSHADETWFFDGTSWFQMGGTSNLEIQYIRDFIGKDTAGATFPDYVSEDLVTDGQDLRLGISQLDDALGTLQYTSNFVVTDYTSGTIQDPDAGASTSSVTDVTKAISDLDAQFGDGAVTDGGNWSLSDDLNWNAGGTLTLTAAIEELNQAIGDRTYTNDFLISDGQTIAGSLDALDSQLGDLDNSTVYTTGGLLTTTEIAGNTVQENLDAFNQELGSLADQTFEYSGSAPATVTTSLVPVVDRLATTEATEIKWLLQVKDASGNRRAVEIHAVTDGTNVDHTTYAVVKVGSPIGGGIGLAVSITGGNWDVKLTPTAGAGNLTYTLKRLGYSYLA